MSPVPAVHSRSFPRRRGRPRSRLPFVTRVPLGSRWLPRRGFRLGSHGLFLLQRRRCVLLNAVFGHRRWWLCSGGGGGVGGLADAGGLIPRLQHVDWLLLVRRINGRGLRGPPGVCLRCQQLDSFLSQDFMLLFLDSGRVEAGLAEPLGPLGCEESARVVRQGGGEVGTRDVDIAVVHAGRVLDDAAGARGMLRNLELPIRVAVQIKAWPSSQPTANSACYVLSLFRSLLPARVRLRQGSCTIFQVYHSFLTRPGCLVMVCGRRQCMYADYRYPN